MLAVVLVFAVRGALRGSIAQAFFFVGLVAGLWAAGWVSQWVGEHWHSARPAVVFWALRWLVAILAGMSLVAIAQESGEHLSEAVRKGPLAWLDRALGVVVGAALGVLVVTLVVLAWVRLGPAGDVSNALARSRVSMTLVESGEQACEAVARVVPASGWLRREFAIAGRRMHGLRSGGSTSPRS